MFIQKLLLILSLNGLFAVQASPIKSLSNYDRLTNGVRNVAVKVIGTQQQFVVKGKTALGKIGRGAAVGSLNLLAVACLTSFALDGCGISDNQQVVGAISNYSQGKAHDERFGQLHEDNYLTYHLTKDSQLNIVLVDEATSTIDTVDVRLLRSYWTVLDWLEPEFSATWDNSLVENGAVLARLLWRRPQTVSWDQLGKPLVAGGLTTTEEINLAPDQLITEIPNTLDGIDGKRFPATDVEMIYGQAIAVFGTTDQKYLVRINRVSTTEGQSMMMIKTIYAIASDLTAN